MFGLNRRQPKFGPSAFTLVELLVAITIFIILTTLTVGAFNLNIGSERVRTTSRMLQAKFEGARSRAFGASFDSREAVPVGIRFILDENNPGLAKGFQFIRGVDDTPKGTLHFVDLTPGDGIPDNTPGVQYLGPFDGDARSFSDLAFSGLLRGGMEIRIDDTPYIIASRRFLADPHNSILQLIPDPRNVKAYGEVVPPGTDFNSGNYGQRGRYQLDVSTVAVPMPGEEIENFPPGAVVDLRNSKLPRTWQRIFPWTAGRDYESGDWIIVRANDGTLKYCQAITGGTSGGSQPDFQSAAVFSTVTDGGLAWRVFDTLHLDILFNGQGNVAGSMGAEGVLHFLVSDMTDIEADLSLSNSAHVPQLKGNYRVVTVYTNSGSVGVSEADLTDSNPGANDPDGTQGVDNIFNYAQQGLSSNK